VKIREKIARLIPNADVRLHTTFIGNSRIGVVSSEDAVFVVFRGTVPSSVRSLVANFRSTRTRWGNGLVHRGFLSLVRSASPFIFQALRDCKADTKDLYFAGHSQGGAAAYLAAMTFELLSGLRRPSAVYTFGQPRAGNAQFSRDAEKRLQRRLSRIVNGQDFVVGVPFVWNGYDHSREYLRYGRNWVISRKTQAAGQGWPLRGSNLGDHGMLRYLRRSHVNEQRPPV
jgi:predicted lipase